MSNETPSLIVIARAFGTYARGDLITDAATIRAIMSGGNAGSIVIPVLTLADSNSSEERR